MFLTTLASACQIDRIKPLQEKMQFENESLTYLIDFADGGVGRANIEQALMMDMLTLHAI